MADQRLSRKDIRQADQFVFRSVQTLSWMREHTRPLIYSTLGVLVVAALVVGWSAWRQHRAQQAEILLHEATKLMQGSARAANRAPAMERLQKLVTGYGSTPAAAFALWYLGHLQFEGGEYPAALSSYTQAQQRFSSASQPLMLALVTLDVGYAQEVSGACSHAINSYESVLQLPAQWLRGEAYQGLGRCYTNTGASDKAITVYERALSDGAINEVTRQAISEQLALVQLQTRERG